VSILKTDKHGAPKSAPASSHQSAIPLIFGRWRSPPYIAAISMYPNPTLVKEKHPVMKKEEAIKLR
jgi:hypothetical protein